ncbi:MAG: FliI/YscN family ATPase [Polyangiales bacterium]
MIDLSHYLPIARAAALPVHEGQLVNAVGLVLEAKGSRASIGDMCQVGVPGAGPCVSAEVVGLRGDVALLMPLGDALGLSTGAPVRRIGRAAYAPVGDALLGRVVDGMGNPLDGRPMPELEMERPLQGSAHNPLNRQPVVEPSWVGVRAMDGMLTLGKGQRIGIFAGGGVGKSTLLGAMVRNGKADVAVVALIGERGREVEEFVNRTLGEKGLERSIVIAATSADPPVVRVRGALYAMTIAEHFRARGCEVLLVMDSVTRFAMAMREVGLSVGEPPTTKGYTASVFAALPRLLERAGTAAHDGAITGVFTVLVEGDDLSDPIADAARAILDGHVVLSRKMAERGYFPAIDVSASVSRVMPHLVDREHFGLAMRARELISSYREAEDLLAVGAYKRGTIARLDDALARYPRLEAFLRQNLEEPTGPEEMRAQLTAIWEDG